MNTMNDNKDAVLDASDKKEDISSKCKNAEDIDRLFLKALKNPSYKMEILSVLYGSVF